MVLYRTVLKAAEAEQVIDKSRFIGYVKPVESKEEAEDFISEIKEMNKMPHIMFRHMSWGIIFSFNGPVTTVNRRAPLEPRSFKCL